MPQPVDTQPENSRRTPPSAPRPAILAPAGSRDAFLAALAAGADGIYCGLKTFSARMAAVNFSLGELAALTALAHRHNTRVYVALNTLLKPDELESAAERIAGLATQVNLDGLIIQDLGLLSLARQAGFTGEIHLSTLANVSFPAALKVIRRDLGVDAVVLPRELGIDEIRAMAAACPKGLHLEVFIHGALCFCVSGRCYWSSYMGGKSGLRGRCVQPCRRVYRQGRRSARAFACQDLSIDVLVKVLAGIPQVRTWKIEGRKKGAHYVYTTVRAYRMLRDQADDPQAKKAAVSLLSQSLGRSGTHYNFLPQRPQHPVDTTRQTASGLFVGKVHGTLKRPFIEPRTALLAGDLLRIGYEDTAGHRLQRLKRALPRKGRLYLSMTPPLRAPSGTPVFLVDRRDPRLQQHIDGLAAQLAPAKARRPAARRPPPSGTPARHRRPAHHLEVIRQPGRRRARTPVGIWLSASALKAAGQQARAGIWWWLPPVIWPLQEQTLHSLAKQALAAGGRTFVLNAPWQIALFKPSAKLNLWAGPFCNCANATAIGVLRRMGFKGVIISPELDKHAIRRLGAKSVLPLGIVLSGNWPLGISRMAPADFAPLTRFTTPRGEGAWFAGYDGLFWLFPDWKLDLTAKRGALEKAGFELFVHLNEPLPPKLKLKKRPGTWNWRLGLK